MISDRGFELTGDSSSQFRLWTGITPVYSDAQNAVFESDSPAQP
jgi:hypothetical protein